jgi:F0F1-type ATP synthase assembly protein I
MQVGGLRADGGLETERNVMSVVRRKPLAGLMLFLMLGLLLGLFFGSYCGYRNEQEALKQWGGNPGADIGDAYPWFMFLGLVIGGFVGLATGIARYLVVRRAESESDRGLDLRSR